MAAEYLIEDAKSGSKTLTYRDPSGSDIRIHSAYDPLKEAERAAAAFSTGKRSHILVSGTGLGYHISALKNRFPGMPLIAVEADESLLKQSREMFPGTFTDVTVIGPGDDPAAVIESIDINSFRGIAHFIHPPSYKIEPVFYDTVFAAISRTLSSKASDLLTRFEFEEMWALNIIRNSSRILKAKPVSALFGKFKGVTGIIVSAGPSLRKNAAVLNLLRDKALIVAVDTAAKVLDRLGVRPHIIMTLDAQKHSLKHFLGLRNTEPVLIADAVGSPPVLRDYPGMKVVSTTSKYHTDASGKTLRETTPMMDWFELHAGAIGDIQSGGSVATSAFDLLLCLGCSKIVLAGQDLAYTGREIHSGGTHHNEGWLPGTNRFLNLETINQRVIRKRKIKYVESFGGGESVISDFVFDLYRGWFEDSARKVKVPVINATEGGARIMNTVESTLAALAAATPRPALSPEIIINRALDGAATLNPGLMDAMRALKSTLDRALDDHAAGALNDSDLLDLASEPSVEPVAAPFLKKTMTMLARRDLNNEEARSMLSREIAHAFRRISSAMGISLKS